ncbi:MAG: hypothetical protein COU35_04210 [Candidatus Magasanikbacteria bacterium CG10_big_fil_rev_8_21_14_0_10_47_10]|uniref:Lipoprotein signal peptidase n=1 Tax=Candidatus Magasanikbacteria bacterium CG10_big_fil_rev_8_21_14_0_10_47_10 TaxID=1974652 RepID=A0A2H0TPR8_9BACT|nr:MAG: hypothetical protein COU35_04210 [Candidatus Magasanikbacteria bacterium CG10_big_fil_rev_8_21_14_0_10_47_10]
MPSPLPHKTHVILSIAISGFFLLLDQFLKYIAYTHQGSSRYLIRPWIGWEFLGNPGVAFSLPVPSGVVLFITPLILLLLFLYYAKQKYQSFLFTLGTMLIFGGAVSNFIDRILFEVTIDYIRIFTSILNVADFMIIAGAFILIFFQKKAV